MVMSTRLSFLPPRSAAALLFLFLAALICGAGQPSFRHLPDQLSQQVARTLIQDRHGYLWIGTGAGLNRYDGADFTAFGSQDGLADDRINDLRETEDGRLWIATSGGLSFWDGRDFTTVPPADPTDEVMISCLSIHAELGLLCGTDQGLYRREGNQLRPLSITGLSEEPIWALAEGRDGALWVGSDTGLSVIRDGEATRITGITGTRILGLLQDIEGLWVASALGLYRLEGDRIRAFHEPESLGRGLVGSLYKDAEGTLWAGTHNGVTKKTGQSFSIWEAGTDLPLNLVNEILEDRDGGLWLAGAPGIALLEEPVFENFTTEDGLGSDVVRDLLIDQRGRLWAATFNGLSYLENERWHTLGAAHGLENPFLISMTTLSSDALMIGSRGGMWILDLDTLSFRTVPGVPRDSSVYCVIEAEGGQWFSLLERGLFFRADDGTIREIEVADQSFYQSRLLIDRQGRLWASGDAGLSRRDEHGWRTWTREDGLANERPYTLFEDSRGRIWMAYHAAAGVSVLDETGIRTYTEQDGLAANTVFMIDEDNEGNLWFGSTAGIDRFDGHRFTLYDKRDGLVGTEANSGAFAHDERGRIWIGTMTGLIRYEPTNDISDRLEPRPHLSSITLDKRPVRAGARVAHERNDMHVEIDFLNFHRRDHLEARIRLIGFDDDWQTWTGTPLFLPNLEPGPYTLEVGARFGNRPWQNTTLTSFTILEPWWMTWPAWLAALVLFLACLFGFGRWRVRVVARRNHALEQMVSERTAELRDEIARRKQAQDDLVAAQDELIAQAHQAGRADVATGVLHNIGNLLSSVTTSAGVVREGLDKSRLTRMADATALLAEHQDDLVAFFRDDPKGPKVIQYLINLEAKLSQEHTRTLTDMERMVNKLDLIRNYIMLHQTYARAEHFVEEVSMAEVIEDALVLQSGSIDRHGIQLEKNLSPLDPVRVQKAKLINILINLYKNAKEAMNDLEPNNRTLRIDLFGEGEEVILKITDNGCGIHPDHREKLFSQGFTTKKDGNGFGLHSCANYMRDMGGSIEVESEGVGRGASFVLRFPRAPGAGEVAGAAGNA